MYVYFKSNAYFLKTAPYTDQNQDSDVGIRHSQTLLHNTYMLTINLPCLKHIYKEICCVLVGGTFATAKYNIVWFTGCLATTTTLQ